MLPTPDACRVRRCPAWPHGSAVRAPRELPGACALLRPGAELASRLGALRSNSCAEHETKAARALIAGAAQIGPAGQRLPRRCGSGVHPAQSPLRLDCGTWLGLRTRPPSCKAPVRIAQALQSFSSSDATSPCRASRRPAGPICAAPGPSGLAALVSCSARLSERSACLQARSEFRAGPQDRGGAGTLARERQPRNHEDPPGADWRGHPAPGRVNGRR